MVFIFFKCVMLLLQSVFQKHGKLVKRVPIYLVPSFPSSRSSRKNSVLLLFLLHIHIAASLNNTSDTRCVWGFRTPSNSATPSEHPSSVLMLSIWRRHQIPQVKGSALQDCFHPTSDASLKSRVSPGLLTNQL